MLVVVDKVVSSLPQRSAVISSIFAFLRRRGTANRSVYLRRRKLRVAWLGSRVGIGILVESDVAPETLWFARRAFGDNWCAAVVGLARLSRAVLGGVLANQCGFCAEVREDSGVSELAAQAASRLEERELG